MFFSVYLPEVYFANCKSYRWCSRKFKLSNVALYIWGEVCYQSIKCVLSLIKANVTFWYQTKPHRACDACMYILV